MMRKLLLACALVMGLYAPSLAQSVVQDNISGNECWNTGQGPGGSSTGWMCMGAVRGGQSIAVTTVAGNHTLGTTTNADTSKIARGGSMIISAQPAAAVLTLPANPIPDGAIIDVCNPTAGAFAANAVTLVANTGQTLTGGTITLTTLAAVTCVRVQFQRSNTTWYRTR